MEGKIPSKIMKSKGFTLVELMIVVAIIGILAGIGVPMYINKVYRGKQKEAVSMLMVLKTEQEEFRAEFNTYYGGTDMEEFLPQSFQANAGAKWYALSMETGWATDELRTSYRAFATGRLAASHPEDIWVMTPALMYANHTGSEGIY